MIIIKATTKKQILPTQYVPVQLTVTFETQEELDRMASLFNHTRVGKVVSDGGCYNNNPIHSALSMAGGSTTRFYDEISNELRRV